MPEKWALPSLARSRKVSRRFRHVSLTVNQAVAGWTPVSHSSEKRDQKLWEAGRFSTLICFGLPAVGSDPGEDTAGRVCAGADTALGLSISSLASGREAPPGGVGGAETRERGVG